MDFMEHLELLRNKSGLFFIFLLISCYHPKKTGIYLNKDSIDLSYLKGIYYLKNKLFSGKLYRLNENYDTILKEGYLNGKKHGDFVSFFNNGFVKEKRKYNYGIKTGIHKGYWSNGSLAFEYNLKNDEYHGLYRSWNIDGTLIQRRNYKNGKEHGTQQFWYNDGEIKSNYIIKNKRRYGLLGTKNCVNVSNSID